MASSTLSISDANLSDIPSLLTVYQRAFYPVSPYMKRCFPETPLISSWWTTVHEAAIKDPNTRLLKVTDSAINDEIIALCRWRLPGSFGSAGGLWTEIPLTVDHDEELCQAFIDPMAEYRHKLMGDRPHYFIELLGSDHSHKGRGIGSMLVQWGCDHADVEGVEIFVETNRAVVPLYQKFGFETRHTMDMPGRIGYEEFFMVRKPKKA